MEKDGGKRMSAAIETEALYKTYDNGFQRVEVLRGIDLTIETGEFVSVMGASGSGKSTLLYLLGSLDKPTAGDVRVNGKSLAEFNDAEASAYRRRDIGFIFQFYNLVPNLTVEENVCLPLIFDGKRVKDNRDRIDEIIDLAGLNDKKRSFPAQLSGGQQQRAAIARALVNGPAIILADEPTGNLDSGAGADIMRLFQKINAERGATIVQVTHSEEAARSGNRIIRVKDGRIVEN
jgi:putative ABC transport system ATP-binding protein